MPKQRKQVGETQQQADERRLLERVANTANRSDKVSWNRKMDNMVKLMAELKPLQEKILDLEEQKQPILGAIAELRALMVKECIHPYDHLTIDPETGVVHCKFCDRNIAVNDGS